MNTENLVDKTTYIYNVDISFFAKQLLDLQKNDSQNDLQTLQDNQQYMHNYLINELNFLKGQFVALDIDIPIIVVPNNHTELNILYKK